ncbi:Pkinase-domain-containing protein [Plenodomus tracheiphilus IPT5]|uniref:Pkinase-domain-containing protein n=1 Tax=Plenodomus tracheiphilus IPT5 TaxID=1408161 RepID=A0A6A7AVI9_9PLEO|nr:Pkinase-domain-containing protein [Plenodomus tracheiphilus IPT5]
MAGVVVGWFTIQIAGVEAFDSHGGYIEICGNEQFYLGRDTELCRYSWSDDLTISRKHLRIHCILYEQDPVAQIAPFVYATDLSANGTYLNKSNSADLGSQDQGVLMGSNNCFLLEHGDELRISDTVTLTYMPKLRGKEAKLSSIQQREKYSFASRYLVTGRMLGEGGYGKVLVSIHQESQRQLACKIVPIGHLHDTLIIPDVASPTGGPEKRKTGSKQRWPTKVSRCFREFDILKDLSHPNVVTLEKVFWSPNTIYLFQELVTGGDLFSFLELKNGRLSSIHSAVIIRQVLKGIEYLHNQDIVHRDLKPDNILMTSLDDGARVVITDFGNARFLPTSKPSTHTATNKFQRMFSYVGTLEFAAPEIHKANKTIRADEGYSKSVDMWSIGSVTATILTGDVIFTDRTHPKYERDPRTVIMNLAGKCDLSVLDDDHHPVWRTIGDRPKDFIRRLLVLEEQGRMTATEALNHPWFSAYAEDFEELYIRSIKNWKPRESNLQLVERISNFVPGHTKRGKSGQSHGEGFTSDFFHSTQQGASQTSQDVVQELSNAQIWRANTPLPSIWEDHETGQFASQVQSQTYSLDDFAREGSNSHEAGSDSRQNFFGTSVITTGDRIDNRAHNVPLACTLTSQRVHDDPVVSSKYSGHTKEEGGSCRSSESLNNVHNNYTQQRTGKDLLQMLASSNTHGSVLVGETPLAEQPRLVTNGHDQDIDEQSYQQTQFPEECRSQLTGAEEHQDSILAYETPPDVGRKHRLSLHSTDSQQFRHGPAHDQTVMPRRNYVHDKRRRLSPAH